jgi:hypothetical protein
MLRYATFGESWRRGDHFAGHRQDQRYQLLRQQYRRHLLQVIPIFTSVACSFIPIVVIPSTSSFPQTFYEIPFDSGVDHHVIQPSVWGTHLSLSLACSFLSYTVALFSF